LIARHRAPDVQLVVCSGSLGANAKVSTLAQLQGLAKHDLIVVSDADVRVPPDFLANVVAPLRDPAVGLVNCFYRLANPTTAAMEWEAIAINADFWSQVLQSQSLKPLDFALGAAMITTRSQLDGIGGFQALVDFLADDYQLGNMIARRGGRIVPSPVVVECWESPKNWTEVWRHQLRWARTIRVCQPLPYFFSLLGNATLWPLLWWTVQLASTGVHFTGSWQGTNGYHTTVLRLPGCTWVVATCLLARILTAVRNQQKLTQSLARAHNFWLAPVKDLLNALIWALAFLGNTVEWRGRRYRVRRGGRLTRMV
jgi:ceramide glucosyltransferase